MPAPRPLHVVHGVLTLGVGGLERMAVSLARIGRARGQRVTVLCVEAAGPLAADAEAAGAKVVALGKPPGRFAEYADRAADLLGELRPDAIHTHQIGAAWYLGRAARRRGVPVLHTEHGNQFARAGGWLGRLKFHFFFHDAARSVDRFCCVSDEIARAVTRWGTVPRAKIEVVSNGIDTADPPDLPPAAVVRASLGIPLGAPVVGTVGRLAEVKRQDLLIRAVIKLRERFPDLRVLLVGDGPDRGKLERLVADLGVSDVVRFAGYQPRPEAFLRAMDVFALTSRSEGFPVSLLEAWAAGLPTVCTAVGGLPAVVSDGENGVLVPPGDVSALSEAVGKVLADRATAARLGAAGRAVVREKYSLDSVAAGYERRYRELVGGGAG